MDQVGIIFIGLFGLTQALGVIGQPRLLLVMEAIGEITKKTRAVGIIADAPRTKQWLDMGIQYLALRSDRVMIGGAGWQFMKEPRRKG